ncbi:uncharacterized protein YALI1_F16527g [Yarrowia lipolytica]|uniref:Uncharacterized protein n=1 Tax=Yarrowia lipolytica TaxID=4952 RepID=A0A1D8NN53_YARLL|nr:hypothetical protein YALI1_F16527g [Yarrowia lipolytica]
MVYLKRWQTYSIAKPAKNSLIINAHANISNVLFKSGRLMKTHLFVRYPKSPSGVHHIENGALPNEASNEIPVLVWPLKSRQLSN